PSYLARALPTVIFCPCLLVRTAARMNRLPAIAPPPGSERSFYGLRPRGQRHRRSHVLPARRPSAVLTVNAVPIDDTFAEAFPMTAARVLVTAETPGWAMTAARSATGYAASVIGCDAEAGVERELSPD